MSYLNLNSRLVITNTETKQSIVFNHISDAEIKLSVKVLGDTATVTIPRRYGKLKDKEVLQYIKAGFSVQLELGYNGEYHTEFNGFVREVGSGYPLKIYIDDAFYKLRKNSFNKSWKSVTLKQLLSEIASGYKIECPDVDLGTFQIDNASTFVTLQALKDQYGFSAFLKDGTLYCQFAYDVRGVGRIHTYDFTKNVKKHSLTYQRKEDNKVRIRAISNQSTGKKVTVEVGNKEKEASVRTLNFRNKTEAELRKLALKTLDSLVFDGFTGNITGFGYPRVMAGDTLELISPKEPEQNGSYLAESVTIRYGNAYYERVCDLSYKVK
ncbi:hypothetical protein [Dysgonomonas sp. 520]|uniref:hypothetical protein n=1 Tax=Dysgonomonas sp. 520 TaxID=2302931 RepID=UPI0013D80AE8|nr:hypothetical protein [Dysgonomonas sp. 520]NDW10951.1 hypothetical protein [Dysgonomonas sp. 520]